MWNTAIPFNYLFREMSIRNFLLAMMAVTALTGCASDEAFDQGSYSSDSLKSTADIAATRDASAHGGFNPGQGNASDGPNSR